MAELQNNFFHFVNNVELEFTNGSDQLDHYQQPGTRTLVTNGTL